jgi:hypothetical protein
MKQTQQSYNNEIAKIALKPIEQQNEFGSNIDSTLIRETEPSALMHRAPLTHEASFLP